MRILFIHQNFPGQFIHLAPALAADPSNEVACLTLQKSIGLSWKGIKIFNYGLKQGSTKGIHPWANDFEVKMIRAQAAFEAALDLKKSGFSPEVIIAHPGWGESLFLKEVWPKARMGIYCEYFYHPTGYVGG